MVIRTKMAMSLCSIGMDIIFRDYLFTHDVLSMRPSLNVQDDFCSCGKRVYSHLSFSLCVSRFFVGTFEVMLTIDKGKKKKKKKSYFYISPWLRVPATKRKETFLFTFFSHFFNFMIDRHCSVTTTLITPVSRLIFFPLFFFLFLITEPAGVLVFF